MKRVFGTVEAIFDIFYLALALALAVILISTASGNYARYLAGVMALILAGGDAFHLVPRIMVIRSGREEKLRGALGTGKQIASITMTLFYNILWQIGVIVFSPQNISGWTNVVYALSAVRIFICLMPQNKWRERYAPLEWSIARNIPFFIQCAIVAWLYFMNKSSAQGLAFMWLAISLSFAFYTPVTIWSNKYPKIGMLMLPKTIAYLWMLFMCTTL